MQKIIALLLVVLSFPQNVVASPDGVELLQSCSAGIRISEGGNTSKKEVADALWCVAYVQGHLDGYAVSSATNAKACFPSKGISTEQAVRIVVEWLKKHPERLHKIGSDEMLLAYANVFPCK